MLAFKHLDLRPEELNVVNLQFLLVLEKQSIIARLSQFCVHLLEVFEHFACLRKKIRDVLVVVLVMATG